MFFFRNKYLLLNSQELNELSAISMKANIPEVEALVNTDRSLVCDGKKGLLTRILTVMKREPPDSSFRSVWRRASMKMLGDQNWFWITQVQHCDAVAPGVLSAFKQSFSTIRSLLLFSNPSLPVPVCRFWQARAVESFLRGATSYADQMFLLKRGLLEVNLQPRSCSKMHRHVLECENFLLPSSRSTSCSAS